MKLKMVVEALDGRIVEDRDKNKVCEKEPEENYAVDLENLKF